MGYVLKLPGNEAVKSVNPLVGESSPRLPTPEKGPWKKGRWAPAPAR
jgi:hypothetical protein